jgi:hypothetical protein
VVIEKNKKERGTRQRVGREVIMRARARKT